MSAQAVTERGQRLKNSLERKFIKGDGNLGVSTTACIERARYWTESMRETEFEPQPIRRAKALANYLAKKTIYILPDELLTGHLGKDIRSIPFYMEYYTSHVLRQSLGDSELMLSKEEWEEFHELEKYWAGKTSEDVVVQNLPEDVKSHVHPPDQGQYKNVYSTLYRYSGNSPGADLTMLWGLGVNGIKKIINESLVKYDAGKCDPELVEDYLHRTTELKAMLIAADGVIHFVDRYSKLAAEMAEKETDPVRKAELLEMVETCNIAEPTKSFKQAVQIAWFEHMLSRSLEMQAAGSPHRMDYLLYPFYKKDIEVGRLTPQGAREIVEDMFLKYERVMGTLVPANVRPAAVGSNMLFQHFTLGGVDPITGRDSTNDLSYLFLDVSGGLHTVQPALSIRVHAGTPDELFAKAWDVLKGGTGGNPSFFGDKAVIEHLLDRGVSLYDARNNCVAGCVAVCVEGKNILTQLKVGGALNMPYLLSLAMNDGVDMLTGKTEGLPVGDATRFGYEEMFDALKKEVVNNMYWGWRGSMIARRVDAKHNPLPWVSCLNQKCITEGLDGRETADHYYPFFGCCSGLVDTADALAAIKKLVYDEKKITMGQLIEACKANWEGHEDILQMCLDAPKFGSGDEYVDSIVNDLFEMIGGEAAKFKDFTGAKFDVQYHSVSTFLSFGAWTPAVPNGRKNRTPLYDGGISPAPGHGKDPSRVLKSVSKIDASKTQRILHNVRLNPSTTTKQFVDFMRTWNDLGLSQVQFNIVDTETLRDAQKQPEKYEELLVRVAGFSAVYINLAPFVQDTIISRVQQDLPSK